MREILVSIVIVLLVVCLVIFSLFELKENAEDKKILNKIESEIGDFRREKKEVQDELQKLKSQHHRETVGASRLMLVFNSLDTTFIEDIYPVMKTNGIPGTICLDPQSLPGVYSFFTKDDLDLLVSEGWQTAVIFDGSASVSDWYASLEKSFENTEIEIPEVVVIDSSIYTDEVESALLTTGVKDVIVVLNKPNILRADVEDTMRVTDAVGWYTTVASSLIDTLASINGDVAYIIGGENAKTKFEESQFSIMIDTLLKSSEKEHIILTTPREAYEYKQERREAYERTVEEYTKKIQELEEKINAIDIWIENVYDKYIEDDD